MKIFNLLIYQVDKDSVKIEADSYENLDGHLIFYDEDNEVIASYPSAITAIVSVETIAEKFF